MNTINHGIFDQPDSAQVRAALDRVVSSPTLRKSPQLGNFLRFVVEQTLAGRAGRIKAYTIAADALGRDSSFDPQHDPIVRVEAGRLRRSLDHYYSNGGTNDPVVIELPRGKYVPVFRANTAGRRALAQFQVLRRRVTELVRENWSLVLLVVIVAATVSLGFDFLWMWVAKIG